MDGSDPLDDAPYIPILSTAVKSSYGEEKITIDEMLQSYSGEFGPWQLRQFLLCSFAWILSAFHIMIVVFTDRQPEWKCTAAATSCSADLCSLEEASREWVEGPSTSTVAEWGLACSVVKAVGLAQSVFFAGSMLGAGVAGHLADSFLGRKGTMRFICILCAAFGCLTAFSPAYWFYVTLRFLTGLGVGGVGMCAFTLATECVGPMKRAAVGMSTFYFFSIGCILLSCTAYLNDSWRTIYVVSSLPSFIYVVAVVPFISESPRWYLIRGRSSEAMTVMQKIADTNGRSLHLSEGRISLVLECLQNSSHPASEKPISASMIDVMCYPVTRNRVIMTILINFFGSIVYYGLTLNVVNLKTNIYESVVLNAVAEMPAYALTTVLLKWWGRKPMLIGSMWLSGMFCLVGSLISDGGGRGVGGEMRMGCGMVGIFAISAMFNLFFVYTAELFPTVVRNAALGSVVQAGQTGAILAPMVVSLGGGAKGRLPFAVFGVCSIVGGILGLHLPETMNKPLCDTFAGGEWP